MKGIKKMIRNKLYIPPEKFYTPAGTNIYRQQERRSEIVRITDFRELEKRRKRYKLGFNPRTKKLGNLLGLAVWLVDGERIRNEVYVDFTSGGHAYRYFYIPLNEIWIDNVLKGGDLKPTIWHEFTERRHMARCWSYNEAHDLAARVEIGIRDGLDFVLPVANFDQSRNDFCGAGALRMVFEYLGKPLEEKEIVKLANTRPGAGTDPKDMARAAKALGFKVIWKEGWTAAEVKKTLDKGWPVIVNFQESPKFGDGHYMVIIGYTNDEFIFSNPSGGKDFSREKINSFMKKWYELEDKTKQEGIAIYK